jgi:hypothetical protein
MPPPPGESTTCILGMMPAPPLAVKFGRASSHWRSVVEILACNAPMLVPGRTLPRR